MQDRQAGHRLDLLADAAHPGGVAAAGSRNIGTEALRDSCQRSIIQSQLPKPAKSAQSGSGIRRAAAEPGRDRQALVEPEAGAGADARDLGELVRCPEHQIVLDRAEPMSKGAGQLQGQIPGRLDGQLIADVGEGHEAVELVVAVGATAGDQEVEIDLRAR